AGGGGPGRGPGGGGRREGGGGGARGAGRERGAQSPPAGSEHVPPVRQEMQLDGARGEPLEEPDRGELGRRRRRDRQRVEVGDELRALRPTRCDEQTSLVAAGELEHAALEWRARREPPLKLMEPTPLVGELPVHRLLEIRRAAEERSPAAENTTDRGVEVQLGCGHDPEGSVEEPLHETGERATLTGVEERGGQAPDRVRLGERRLVDRRQCRRR